MTNETTDARILNGIIETCLSEFDDVTLFKYFDGVGSLPGDMDNNNEYDRTYLAHEILAEIEPDDAKLRDMLYPLFARTMVERFSPKTKVHSGVSSGDV